MKIFKFSLHISAQEMKEYYSGKISSVHVIGVDGRSIQFPADILRPFVEHNGVHGWFQLKVNDDKVGS